jgi:hypothetical protein
MDPALVTHPRLTARHDRMNHMTKRQPELVTYGGQSIPVGGTAELDGNYPVTVTAIRPSYDDEDDGRVTIRYEWGATEDVDPVRLYAYISD